VLGIAQLGYGGWAAWSDAAVKPVFAADHSCALAAFADTAGRAGGACTFSVVIVSSRDDYGGKSGSRYSVRVYDASEHHERVSLGGSPDAHTFWRRLIVGQPLRLQRFVAPGYHVTGRVVAVNDGRNSLMSTDSPSSPAAPNFVNIFMGLVTTILGLAFLRARRDRPLPPA
jgi:hypothetical protein